MWTYLVIFFSVALLVGVFVRRVFLYMKARKGDRVEPEKEEKKEGGSEGKRLIKLARKDQEEVADLCKKAESKMKVGREDEAIKYYVQALAIDQHHIETQHKLAMLYMRKQMFSAAAALFKNLGELTGEAVHYSHLGLAMFQQKEFEEAKDAYQRAVELDPSRPQRFVSLAQVYRSLGQMQNALIALNKAVEIDDENIEYLFFLADVQAELGNFLEAKHIIDKVLELEPKNEDAWELLKSVEERQKEALTGGSENASR